MENKEALIQEYEKLRVQEYEEDMWSTYYVSTYATTDTVEDMCEQYAFYMSNPQYRSYMLTNEHHKAKSDVLRQYLIEEYNYDFYEE